MYLILYPIKDSIMGNQEMYASFFTTNMQQVVIALDEYQARVFSMENIKEIKVEKE